MRLIDADTAIDAFDKLCDANCVYSKKQRAVMCGACLLGSAFDVIDELPTAERKGYWIGTDNDKVKCNYCGKSYDWTSEAQYYDYCPSCGARMEGEHSV